VTNSGPVTFPRRTSSVELAVKDLTCFLYFSAFLCVVMTLSIPFLKYSMCVYVPVSLKYIKWGCVKCYKKVKLFLYLIRYLSMKKIGSEGIIALLLSCKAWVCK
jgi:hypothetical protein